MRKNGSKYTDEQLKIMAQDTVGYLQNGDPQSKFKAQQVVMYIGALCQMPQQQVLNRIVGIANS